MLSSQILHCIGRKVEHLEMVLLSVECDITEDRDNIEHVSDIRTATQLGLLQADQHPQPSYLLIPVLSFFGHLKLVGTRAVSCYSTIL